MPEGLKLEPVDLVLERLGDYEPRNGYFMAPCPAHEDPEPSLSVKEGEAGRVLLHCFAGCKTPEIAAALGISMSELFLASSTNGHHNGHKKTYGRPTVTWEIRDASGRLQAEHVRFDRPNGGKACFWRLPGASGWGLKGRKISTLPLYRSELVEEWPGDVPVVVVVEGEKSADALAGRYPAVLGTVTGAEGTPGPEILEVLRGRRVVLWPDNDGPGRRHMERVGAALDKAGISGEVRIFEWEGAPSKGDAADHPAVIGRSRESLRKLLGEMAAAPVRKPVSSSSSSLAYRESDDDDDVAGVVWFSELGELRPREFLVEDVVPARYMSIIHGAGGVAKSLLALKLGIAYAAGRKEWLGLAVNGSGPVLYLDFELDADEQLRRVWELCSGLRIPVPKDVCYLSALGKRTPEAFGTALEVCRRHEVRLVILDSLGPAMLGDAERASDFLAFYNEYLVPFREAGVTLLVIDHQGKLQAGEKCQDKGAFGSAYKSHMSRSLMQIERVGQDRDAGTLTIRLRHTKSNFGPHRDPLDVRLTFAPGSITAEFAEVDATELAGEGTLNADDRVQLALKAGPAFPDELSERTGLVVGTVQNSLTRLRGKGSVENTGEMKGRAQQVQLASSSSLAL